MVLLVTVESCALSQRSLEMKSVGYLPFSQASDVFHPGHNSYLFDIGKMLCFILNRNNKDLDWGQIYYILEYLLLTREGG